MSLPPDLLPQIASMGTTPMRGVQDGTVVEVPQISQVILADRYQKASYYASTPWFGAGVRRFAPPNPGDVNLCGWRQGAYGPGCGGGCF